MAATATAAGTGAPFVVAGSADVTGGCEVAAGTSPLLSVGVTDGEVLFEGAKPGIGQVPPLPAQAGAATTVNFADVVTD